MSMKKVKTTAAIIAFCAGAGLVLLLILKGIKYAMIISISASIGAAISAWFTRKYYVAKIEEHLAHKQELEANDALLEQE
jgi:uncharacterized membrane protein YfcA